VAREEDFLATGAIGIGMEVVGAERGSSACLLFSGALESTFRLPFDGQSERARK
jgi:hypothetical protein